MIFRTLAAAAAVAVVMPAHAQSGGFYAGVTGGTLGIGPELGFRSSNFGVRGNASFLGVSREIESDGVNYDGDLRLRSFGAMADLYPGGGGFRISAGARINRNRIELKATPTGTVEIGNVEYLATQVGVLNGEIRANKLAPVLTIGWAGGPSRGFKFGIDAGAMFQGSPEVTKLQVTGPLATNTAFQQQLAIERAEVEDDIDRFKVYPVLQLSLGYLFGGPREAAYVEPVAPPPPPPAAPATQTCPDGSVILATDMCPPPPPPPPATPSGERG
jgi:hypothetical protein